ncbi:unnamed protein product [Nippostrongylus brasiliensis]|uniref:Structural protein n=1 Tax=Nippostrongylus brasiliensis TaxID=27835 RepID=A0A0N4Y0H2_NIPBR|nr:unnamed protein product [Nippostrongylus brasiliensis]
MITMNLYCTTRKIEVIIFATTTLRAKFAGSSDDYEWIQDPVFTMDISPPTGWTYFPAVSSDNYQIWYFVGQSNNSATAEQRSTAEIEGAMLEALAAASIPAYGITVTNDYTPIQIENPTTNTKGAGPLYGKEEGGAITQTAPTTTGAILFVMLCPLQNIFQIENPTTNTKGAGPLYGKEEGGAITQTAPTTTGTFTWAPYSKTVKVTLANVANTRQKWNIVKNTFMLKLSLNFYARFVGEVVVSKY